MVVDIITDAILNVIFLPVLALLQLLPAMDISLDSSIYDGLSAITANVGYVLPMSALAVMWGIKIAIRSFGFIWTILLKIKSFIPTMGD